MEATKTKHKSGAQKRKERKARQIATIEGNGDAPGQKYIPGTEPPSIPAMDADIRKRAALVRECEAKKQEIDKLNASLPRRMHDEQLSCYVGAGHTVTLVEGHEVIRVKPAKTQ